MNYVNGDPDESGEDSRVLLVLFGGVVAASFSAIFIRLSTADPFAIAFYRMFFASLMLLPVVTLSPAKRAEFGKIDLKYFSLILLGGLFLSLHLAAWVSSLSYTSVASSVVLVTSQPIFTAIFEYVFLKQRASRFLVLGIAIAVGGSVLIGYGDLLSSDLHFFGDMLALGGAVMAAGYFFVGGRVRQKIRTYPYILLVYSTSSVFLLIFSLGRGVRLLEISAYNYTMFFLLALIPTIIGHTCFNWALENVRPSRVVTTILGEPIGASILAAVIFGEIPSLWASVGGFLVLCGIYFTWKGKRTSPQGND